MEKWAPELNKEFSKEEFHINIYTNSSVTIHKPINVWNIRTTLCSGRKREGKRERQSISYIIKHNICEGREYRMCTESC
jgi:hypothetical protein